MGSKEKLKLVRSEDFELVDQELTEAMSLVDAANDRVSQLLNEERSGATEDSDDEALFGGAPVKTEATLSVSDKQDSPAAQEESG